MKFKVLKGCVLEKEIRKVGSTIDLSDPDDIRIGLSNKQIEEYKAPVVKKAVVKSSYKKKSVKK